MQAACQLAADDRGAGCRGLLSQEAKAARRQEGWHMLHQHGGWLLGRAKPLGRAQVGWPVQDAIATDCLVKVEGESRLDHDVLGMGCPAVARPKLVDDRRHPRARLVYGV